MPSTLEGCIVRLVDKVAYAGRDLEDAISSSMIQEKDIPSDVIDILGKRNADIVGTLL